MKGGNSMARSSQELIKQLKSDLEEIKQEAEKTAAGQVIVDGAVVVMVPGSSEQRGYVSPKDTDPVDTLSKKQDEGALPVGFAYYVATKESVRANAVAYPEYADDLEAKQALVEAKKEFLIQGEIQRHAMNVK
jgi:hypothetical protein